MFFCVQENYFYPIVTGNFATLPENKNLVPLFQCEDFSLSRRILLSQKVV